MTDHFQEFFKEYPRPTGIGAARRSWGNQIFFHNAKPEQMLEACKVFRQQSLDIDTQYTLKPSKWLEDQCYLDPDLQPREKAELPNFLEKLSSLIGEHKVLANCQDSELVDGILYLQTTDTLANLFKNNNETYLKMCDIVDVKPHSELNSGSKGLPVS